MFVESAMMMVMVMMSVISLFVGKSKKGKGNNDPVVGKRYWADVILSLATYSKSTAYTWFNRTYLAAEESIMHYPSQYASYYGEQYEITPGQPVNTLSVTNFTIGYDTWASRGGTWENQATNLKKANKIPHFLSWDGHNPMCPCHSMGIVQIYGKQIYMGLNTAQLPSIVSIISCIPGTTFNLMSQGTQFNNFELWVRFRHTLDLSATASLNPVVIISDLLLDFKKEADIDWLNFADTGVKLLKQRPYMWFAMVIGENKISDVIRDVLNKAKLALRTMPDGRVGLKMVGELPEDGVQSVFMLDALEELSEFSITRADISESSNVINEIRGTYNAARCDLISTYESIVDAVIPPAHLAGFKQWELENAPALIGKTLADKIGLYPGIMGNEDVQTETLNLIAGLSQGEWHYMEYDAHAVNTANIVLTGSRRRESLNIDFLSWPDDAVAYLEDALREADRSYLVGEIKGNMRLFSKEVGDLIRLVVRDTDAMVVIDRIFEVTEVNISAWPEEAVSIGIKENSSYYDMLTPLQGEPGGTDPTQPSLYPPSDAIINPDGSVTFPDGTTVGPGGAGVIPPGSVTDPITGIITTPDGFQIHPDGKAYDKNGNIIFRPGTEEPEPNVPTAPDPEPPPTWPIEEQLFQIPMIAQITSVGVFGIPAACACITWATRKLAGSEVYYVDNCAPETPKNLDNRYIQDTGSWPFNFKLLQDFRLKGTLPGSVGSDEIYAKMILPKAAKIDTVLNIFSSNVKSLGSTRALLFEQGFSMWSWILISDATLEEPAGVATFMRFTFAEVSKVADDGIYVRLRGLYCADIERTITFPAGSTMTMLATTSSNVGNIQVCGIPAPAAAVVPLENTHQRVYFKTVVSDSKAPLTWPRCHCAEYIVEDDWHATPPFDVWVHNTSNPFGAYGERDIVFIAGHDDTLEVWANVIDFTNIETRKELFGIAVPNRSNGFDVDHTVNDTQVKSGAAECESAVKLFRGKVIIKQDGVPKAEFELDPVRKIGRRFTLRELGITAKPGQSFEVFVEGDYRLTSAMMAGGIMETKKITVKGPVVYCE